MASAASIHSNHSHKQNPTEVPHSFPIRLTKTADLPGTHEDPLSIVEKTEGNGPGPSSYTCQIQVTFPKIPPCDPKRNPRIAVFPHNFHTAQLLAELHSRAWPPGLVLLVPTMARDAWGKEQAWSRLCSSWVGRRRRPQHAVSVSVSLHLSPNLCQANL